MSRSVRGGALIATDAPDHVPVLVDRVVELALEAPDGPYVDATLGAGGHAFEVVRARLARHGSAHLIGIDRDPDALLIARARLEGLASTPGVTIDLVHARFDRIGEVIDGLGVASAAFVLADLGTSSMQLDRAERGFSYRRSGPIDMRMDTTQHLSASDVINDWSEHEIADVLSRFGEERFAGRIARAIVAARPLVDTDRLAEVVRDAIPAATRRTGPHPATRTFQALRIAVNEELDALDRFLPSALARLAPGGVLAVLAYHSLEDRAVKQAFAAAARTCVCPPDLPMCACGAVATVEHVVRRAEVATEVEIAANPRSASVRLRAVRRLEVGR